MTFNREIKFIDMSNAQTTTAKYIIGNRLIHSKKIKLTAKSEIKSSPFNYLLNNNDLNTWKTN